VGDAVSYWGPGGTPFPPPNTFSIPAELKEASDAMEAERGQVGGDHYSKRKIQPFQVIDDWGLDFYALKYLARHKDKNGKEDLLKAIHYINEVIKRQYPEEGK
jgi:hypothetical protein